MVYIAYRLRPLFRPHSPEQTRPRPLPRRGHADPHVAAGRGRLVLGVFAGASAVGGVAQLPAVAQRVPFGRKDAYFGKDIGFYVFDLPWLHYLVDFAMAVAVVALLAAALVHYLYGGIRLQTSHDRLSGAAQAQLSVLLGVFVLAKAADYWLDRFDLVTSPARCHRHDLHRRPRGAAGQEHPDGHRGDLRGAVLPQRVAPHLAAAVGGPGAARAVRDPARPDLAGRSCSSSRSSPPRPDKEDAYIEKNIEATRAAYDLGNVETDAYTPDGDLGADQEPRAGRADGVGAARRPAAGAADVRAEPAGRVLLLGRRGARRRPVQDRRHRPGARARRARAQPERHRPAATATGRTCTPSTPTATA